MVRWYHAIFTAYGFWLPNDPRGSWSDFVASWELFKFAGSATKTSARHSLAMKPHDASNRRAAKGLLAFDPVRFDRRQQEFIAAGIEQACIEAQIVLHALAIGYDHVHAIVGRHPKTIEDVVRHFKSRATQQMSHADCHPMWNCPKSDGALHTPWAEGCWHVFINDEPQLQTAIEYVTGHPAKEGQAAQNWPFITPV
jgi:REP element-mobilizing transposase RayT